MCEYEKYFDASSTRFPNRPAGVFDSSYVELDKVVTPSSKNVPNCSYSNRINLLRRSKKLGLLLGLPATNVVAFACINQKKFLERVYLFLDKNLLSKVLRSKKSIRFWFAICWGKGKTTRCDDAAKSQSSIYFLFLE